MAGVAHTDRHAEHRHVKHEQYRAALGPGRRAVQDVAPDHLVDDGDHQQAESGHAQLQAQLRDQRARAREGVHSGRKAVRGLSPPDRMSGYFVSWMRLTMLCSFGSARNLSYTGFMACWNEVLSTSMICAPPAVT